jgi:hypothetical protein
LHVALPPQYPDTTTYTSHINSTASTHTATALQHLDLAYKHYISLPKHQQNEIWQIELARAFTTEKQKKKEVEDSLEAVMAEARQLSDQVEYLSRCQWPREMALWPPDRKPIRTTVIKAMESDTAKNRKRRKTAEYAGQCSPEDSDPDDDKRWDYDTLVGKWKKVVQEDAVRKRGLTLPVPYNTPVPTTTIAATISSSGGAPNTSSSHHPPITSPAIISNAPPLTPASKQDPDPTNRWSKKARLETGGNDRVMGYTDPEQQHHQHPHQHPQTQAPPSQRHSNLRDLVAFTGSSSRQSGQNEGEDWLYHADGGGGGGGGGGNGVYSYGNGTGREHGHGHENGSGDADGNSDKIGIGKGSGSVSVVMPPGQMLPHANGLGQGGVHATR